MDGDFLGFFSDGVRNEGTFDNVEHFIQRKSHKNTNYWTLKIGTFVETFSNNRSVQIKFPIFLFQLTAIETILIFLSWPES